MKKNVGTVDAIFRISFGLTGLAWSTAKMVRHPYRSMPMLCGLLSAMKVAEGITRYCPMLDLFGANSIPPDEQKKRAIARKANSSEGYQDPSI